MRLPTPSCRSAYACVLAATLVLPMAAAGEEIRVLFVPSPATDVQTRALERAIADNSHSVRVVKDLADADVLLQFTDYRIEHRRKGGPWRWWEGRVKVLLSADSGLEEVARAFRLPERFALVIMGEGGGTEMERTVEGLENFLRLALGRDTAKRGVEAIQGGAPPNDKMRLAKTNFKSVDEYIATHPPGVQAILQRVRNTIRKALPGAQEAISYQIPTYKLYGGYVIYFAGWKQHYSLYPVTGRLVAALGDELAPYEVNNKGTIRFPLAEPVPVRLIERIAKLLAKEAADRARAKRAAPKKRR